MKVINISDGMDPMAEKAIRNIITNHEHYSKCYFWRPASSAKDRRDNESLFRIFNEDILIITSTSKIAVIRSYEETSSCIYYKCNVTVNGKKSNIRLIKNLLKNHQNEKM